MDDEEIITIKKLKDGRSYSVRHDRHRYFFPDEWLNFIGQVRGEEHKLFFETLLFTGCRSMEALNLRACDFDFERGVIDFRTTKQRKARSDFESMSKHRQFIVSSKYLRKVKKFVRDKGLSPNQLLFLNNQKLPQNYYNLSNAEKKNYYYTTENSYYKIMRRAVKKSGIKDWKNFSLHNLKKTYGNWMRIGDLRTEELCYRLGDDMQTFFTNYGSSIIFTSEERRQILSIYGDIR